MMSTYDMILLGGRAGGRAGGEWQGKSSVGGGSDWHIARKRVGMGCV